MICKSISLSMAYHFIFLTISFKEQVLLILMKCNSSVCFFVAHALGVITQKSLPNQMSQRSSHMFSSRSFVSCFILRDLTYFELSFGCEARSESKFTFLLTSFSNTIHWKAYPFPIVLTLYLCRKSVGHIQEGLFLYCLFCFIDLFVYLCQWHTVLISLDL